MDIIRADTVERGECSVKNMIQSVVVMHAFHGDDIPRIPHNADLAVVPLRTAADIALLISDGIVAAYFAVTDAFASLP